MDIDVINNSRKVVGTKQTLKAVRNGTALKVFLAKNADDKVKAPVTEIAREKDIEVIEIEDMKQLGELAGIDVATATVAILK